MKLKSFIIIIMVFLICSFATKEKSSFYQTILPDPDTTRKSFLSTTRDLRTSVIPDSIFEMTDLEELSIQGMDCDYGDHLTCWAISSIPAKIKNLSKLRVLRLEVNAISIVPFEIRYLKNLKELSLSDNLSLISIENVIALENLESLSVFGCNLKILPRNISNLKKLKYLGLTGNQISQEEIKRARKALPKCEIVFHN